MITVSKKSPAEFLKDLKGYYQIYSHRCDEWIEYVGEQNFTQEELYALTVYIKNDFKISIQELIMFYHKTEFIERIYRKLEITNKEFEKESLIKTLAVTDKVLITDFHFNIALK